MSGSFLDHDLPPEPMAALTHTVISPENIALDARLNRAKPMGRFALLKARFRLWQLERVFKRTRRKDIESECQQLESELQTLRRVKFDLQAKRQIEPSDKQLEEQWLELKEEIEPKWGLYKALVVRLSKTDKQAKEYRALKQQVEENPEVVARAKRDADKMDKQRAECKNYEEILIDRWTQQGFCYRYTDKRGNKKVERVGFSERHITPEAIFLKIAITEMGVLGSMRTLVPYGVSVTNLVKPETLEELSLACQRQISAKVDYIRGTWIIVNRLDTTDGLLNQVRYADVMERYPVKFHERVPICVGVAERKQVQWLNLTDYPHGLIAGFTGSGKSNFVNAVICTLITKHKPDDMRLILVDLKEGVEFATYAGIPHLYGPVVETVKDLADKLEEISAIMRQRYQQIRGKGLNIGQYNAKVKPEERMARIVVVVDEVVSTIDNGDYTKRIGSSLKQLVAKGRAAGIHIILSTQRPSVDAIQGLIKINLSFRIVGRMPSHTDSLTVLGSGAAKDLPNVPGRMVMQLGPDPIPVQTPMIDEHDVEAALKVAMQYEKPASIPVPENAYTQTEWTPERIVALSLQHLGGNISHTKVWEEIKEDGSLSRAQTRALCERIWAMDCIEFEGMRYKVVKGKSAVRKLTAIEVDMALGSENTRIPHVTLVADLTAV